MFGQQFVGVCAELYLALLGLPSPLFHQLGSRQDLAVKEKEVGAGWPSLVLHRQRRPQGRP